jgi:hypothetical protein
VSTVEAIEPATYGFGEISTHCPPHFGGRAFTTADSTCRDGSSRGNNRRRWCVDDVRNQVAGTACRWEDPIVSLWDELTLEQYAVLVSAYDEAYLNNVMDEYGMRPQWAKTRDIRGMSNLDDDGTRRLIPHFAAVVLDMIERDWIQIKEQSNGDWDDWPAMTDAQLRATLDDPATWITRLDGEHRMIMLLTSDHWDEVVGRFSAHRTSGQPATAEMTSARSPERPDDTTRPSVTAPDRPRPSQND